MDGEAVENIAALATQRSKPEVMGNTALPVKPFIVVRSGKDATESVQYLETLLVPALLAQQVEFDDVGSLIDYVNKYKTADSRLFVNLAEAGKFTAVLDYHTDATSTTAATAKPQFCKHVVSLPLKQTPEFAAWRGISGRAVSQIAFAEFLEDNLAAVVRPTAADLLETALTLEAKKSMTFKQGVRLENGDVNLNFVNETTGATAGGSGQLQIPTKIELNVALYEGAEPQPVVCRFRYRISEEGGLTFTVIIEQLERLVRSAIDAVAKQIERETKITVWRGSAAL